MESRMEQGSERVAFLPSPFRSPQGIFKKFARLASLAAGRNEATAEELAGGGNQWASLTGGRRAKGIPWPGRLGLVWAPFWCLTRRAGDGSLSRGEKEGRNAFLRWFGMVLLVSNVSPSCGLSCQVWMSQHEE